MPAAEARQEVAKALVEHGVVKDGDLIVSRKMRVVVRDASGGGGRGKRG